MGDYSIAVRSLCEFTAKSGDLSARFTPAPTARQGIAGHVAAAARRGGRYLRELALEGRHESLIVRGRADGYDPQSNLLEEFKTHRGDLGRMPANQRGLHWAQLKIYGALMCRARALAALDLALVYIDVKTEEETSLAAHCTAAELHQHFTTHCESFLDWARQEFEHRRRRDRFLTALEFPHPALRAGQRQLAEGVYRAARRRSCVMIQAPTGIGKTIGTLFPLLKAAPAAGLDKIYFLVAKTSGRDPALHALDSLAPGGAALRRLELVSKETACQFPGRACEAASCPLAKGFYDRLAGARAAAIETAALTQATVRRVALEHEVCPYHLTQELIRWADVLVGDYNYFFDTSAILFALAAQNQWSTGLLVDEAHNLVPRGRDMYSATLDPAVLDAAFVAAPAAVKRQLLHVRRAWESLDRAQAGDYAVHAAIPTGFVAHLQRATTAIADDISLDPSQPSEAVLRFHFDALHFCRLAEDFGSHSLFDVTHSAHASTLCIRCVDPGPHLARRFAGAAVSVLFSATLGPSRYYRQLLGLPADAGWLDVDSPFNAAQLTVRVARRISTRYRDRGRSLIPIADLMSRQYRVRPGNYMAFFSSFDYLHAVAAMFKRRHPAIDVWQQVRGMAHDQRAAFLARFTPVSRGIGFAVLGGAFAEGVDLPGERLIGAFITTLGLPQVNDVNSEIERRMHALFGLGYEYTYLYPGLQKVVQAAGRVIRTPSDQGTVHLIDDRYLHADVRELLPAWWQVRCS